VIYLTTAKLISVNLEINLTLLQQVRLIVNED